MPNAELNVTPLRRLKHLAILCGVALLVASCLGVGGCRERRKGMTEIVLMLEVKPKRGFEDVFAEVFLDGDRIASVGNSSHIRFEVPSGGMHTIRVEAPGYRAAEKEIRILDTRRQDIHFELRKR